MLVFQYKFNTIYLESVFQNTMVKITNDLLHSISEQINQVAKTEKNTSIEIEINIH